MKKKAVCFSLVCWMVGMGLVGCGRSVHVNTTASEGQKPSREDSVQVGWQKPGSDSLKQWAGNSWVAIDGIHYSSDFPISIPAKVPVALDFKVNVPRNVAAPSLMFRASILESDGRAVQPVAQMARDGNSLSFRISGLDDEFSKLTPGDGGGKRAVLEVVGTDAVSGTMKFEGKMLLTTPPSRLDVTQESVTVFEKHSGTLDASQKSFNSPDGTQHLLQVLTFHNPSDLAVDVILPKKPLGSLIAHFQKIVLHTEECSYSSETQMMERLLGNGLWLNALSPATMDAESGDRIRFSIPHQGNAWVGIYSSGEDVAEVVRGSYPKSEFDETQVVVSCVKTCNFYDCSHVENVHIKVPVKNGIQALGITVEVDSHDLDGTVSFPGTNNQGDPESADVPIFSKVSIQRE